MKFRFLIVSIVLTTFTFTSCREEVNNETIVREVRVEKEDIEVAEKENEGILERTARKVDTEVNKEIDEEIEKIGDDN
ncbi:hypothetical protein [Salinimicrobium terrae]|uniref:hypothetical protein n=1 Tax=Salinimicrobium terrae TaxID=470866 RepID=UPI0004200D0E|nr:hypothetical protein [Salinimicrobium terrae]